MKIERYGAELSAPLVARVGARGMGAQRVQEWLGLHGIGVVIDAEFGPATAKAVSIFQGRNGLPETGEVDESTWRRLVRPLADATPPGSLPFGAAVVAIAEGHLKARAREIGGDNRGPWVRHYCRGQSVAWCQGFASTMWADADRAIGGELPLNLVLDGIWCLFVPRMVQEARRSGLFSDGRSGAVPAPGSMFFVRGGPYGYTHVGLVVQAHGDTMTTIEGNTNDDGSPNGYEVARRVRTIAASDFALVKP
jgi:peptidoglycan hydrolase-like protein with peptidoglycan-binding domain